jgi:hypothetical protein
MKALIAIKSLRAFAALAFLLLAASGLVLFLHWDGFSPPVVLHFAPLQGADLFGERSDVLTLFVLGALVIGVNLFLAEVFYDRSRELSFLFGGVATLLALFLLIAIGTIVAIN